MKYVIIRDDDVSFFTPVEVLETLYRPLLSRGGTASLSVIPAIACGRPVGAHNGPFWTRYKMDYSPFIPPDFRDVNQHFPVSDNSELVSYLRENPGYELLQHGYDHSIIDGLPEGKRTDRNDAEMIIRDSAEIMLDAFGHTPDFFVGPWDAFSPQFLKNLSRHFKGISMYRLGKRHMPWHLKPIAVARRLYPGGTRAGFFRWKDFVIFEHPGTMISMFNRFDTILPSIKAALDRLDVLVLVSHHWEFFYDWNGLNQPFFEVWLEIIDFLLSTPSIQITSFQEMHQTITGNL
jgi:peptidoglycan/xylan/chitin deacetylase (PgdA/CDA1 family)